MLSKVMAKHKQGSLGTMVMQHWLDRLTDHQYGSHGPLRHKDLGPLQSELMGWANWSDLSCTVCWATLRTQNMITQVLP